MCAGLLIAAPLAIVLSSGGAEAGGTRNPGGVFQGGPDDGTGRGSGVPGASVTTAASQTPAPAGGDQATGVSPAAEAGGAVGANGGGGGWVPAGGGGTVIQPGTAAGAPAPAAAGGQQPGAQQPAGQQPAAQQPAQQPAPQQSASQGAAPQQSASPQTDPNGYPCPCQVINGVLTSLAAPLPKLPSGPLG